MDIWGPEGCRLRRAEVLAWLREAQGRLGRAAKLKAAARAALTGLAFRLCPWDPLGSLVDLAIARARRKARRGRSLAA
jgi:hypothetical protein